jgi:hypothetical protein
MQAEQGRGAKTAADPDNVSFDRNFEWHAERADEVENLVPNLQLAEKACGCTDFLYDNRKCARIAVVVGDRQGNALAALTNADDYELPGFCGFRDQRRIDPVQLGNGRQWTFFQDLCHGL